MATLRRLWANRGTRLMLVGGGLVVLFLVIRRVGQGGIGKTAAQAAATVPSLPDLGVFGASNPLPPAAADAAQGTGTSLGNNPGGGAGALGSGSTFVDPALLPGVDVSPHVAGDTTTTGTPVSVIQAGPGGRPVVTTTDLSTLTAAQADLAGWAPVGPVNAVNPFRAPGGTIVSPSAEEPRPTVREPAGGGGEEARPSVSESVSGLAAHILGPVGTGGAWMHPLGHPAVAAGDVVLAPHRAPAYAPVQPARKLSAPPAPRVTQRERPASIGGHGRLF